MNIEEIAELRIELANPVLKICILQPPKIVI